MAQESVEHLRAKHCVRRWLLEADAGVGEGHHYVYHTSNPAVTLDCWVRPETPESGVYLEYSNPHTGLLWQDNRMWQARLAGLTPPERTRYNPSRRVLIRRRVYPVFIADIAVVHQDRIGAVIEVMKTSRSSRAKVRTLAAKGIPHLEVSVDWILSQRRRPDVLQLVASDMGPRVAYLEPAEYNDPAVRQRLELLGMKAELK